MTIEERLDRLERHNRRLKAGMGSLVAVGVAAGLVGLTQPEAIPELIEARAFHVVDADGTLLVRLQDSEGEGKGVDGSEFDRPDSL